VAFPSWASLCHAPVLDPMVFQGQHSTDQINHAWRVFDEIDEIPLIAALQFQLNEFFLSIIFSTNQNRREMTLREIQGVGT
jgi:hypothetical protein